MAITYRAAWVLPINRPPIAGGIVVVDAGRVTSVGAFDGAAAEDLGNVAILPGLVNAHTHLELSWMRNRVPPSDSMPKWAAQLMALKTRGSEALRAYVRNVRLALFEKAQQVFVESNK